MRMLSAFRGLLSRCWKIDYGKGGVWFGTKNNSSLLRRENATLIIIFTVVIIIVTILSSLEISLSQSLQNIVFKYLTAQLSLVWAGVSGSQLNSHYSPI